MLGVSRRFVRRLGDPLVFVLGYGRFPAVVCVEPSRVRWWVPIVEV